MAKTRKIPLRKSVVSGEIIDKRDLLRIVKTKDGEIFIDPTGKKNGRGAYIKLDNEEALQAKKKRAFNHSFSMDVPESFYDELIAYVDHRKIVKYVGTGTKSWKAYFWRRTCHQGSSIRTGETSFSCQ